MADFLFVCGVRWRQRRCGPSVSPSPHVRRVSALLVPLSPSYGEVEHHQGVQKSGAAATLIREGSWKSQRQDTTSSCAQETRLQSGGEPDRRRGTSFPATTTSSWPGTRETGSQRRRRRTPPAQTLVSGVSVMDRGSGQVDEVGGFT